MTIIVTGVPLGTLPHPVARQSLGTISERISEDVGKQIGATADVIVNSVTIWRIAMLW